MFDSKNMANTYHQVYIQAVFAVKYRESTISPIWKDTLFSVLGQLVTETGCRSMIVNGVEDHVHCLIGLKPTVSIAELMQSVKAKSSKYVNEEQLSKKRFKWQEGYGVFSYSQSHVETVYDYVLNQEKHHKETTFKKEYTTLLDMYKVPYEERYIFQDLI